MSEPFLILDGVAKRFVARGLLGAYRGLRERMTFVWRERVRIADPGAREFTLR